METKDYTKYIDFSYINTKYFFTKNEFKNMDNDDIYFSLSAKAIEHLSKGNFEGAHIAFHYMGDICLQESKENDKQWGSAIINYVRSLCIQLSGFGNENYRDREQEHSKQPCSIYHLHSDIRTITLRNFQKAYKKQDVEYRDENIKQGIHAGMSDYHFMPSHYFDSDTLYTIFQNELIPNKNVADLYNAFEKYIEQPKPKSFWSMLFG